MKVVNEQFWSLKADITISEMQKAVNFAQNFWLIIYKFPKL